jgi:hypothetical protein
MCQCVTTLTPFRCWVRARLVTKILLSWRHWELRVILFPAVWHMLTEEVWLSCGGVFSFFLFSLSCPWNSRLTFQKKIVSYNLQFYRFWPSFIFIAIYLIFYTFWSLAFFFFISSWGILFNLIFLSNSVSLFFIALFLYFILFFIIIFFSISSLTILLHLFF